MLATLLLTVVLTPPPPPFAGVVLRAVDGDTLDVLTEFGPVVRVRLLGVDTPELHHPRKPPQPFAAEAAAYTRANLVGRVVAVRGDGLSGLDPYGRALGYVWVGGRLHNLGLIREGLGFLEGQYPFARLRSFAELETRARLAGVGAWSLVTRMPATGAHP